MESQTFFLKKISKFFYWKHLKKPGKIWQKDFLKRSGCKKTVSHPERDPGKFRNRPLALMHYDAVRIARTIIGNPPGNRDQLAFGRRDILDTHRYRNAVRPAAVGSNPECLVSERKDRAAMGNAARVHLAGTVHGNAGISFRCVGDLHLQEPGKLAAVKNADLFRDC
jgi:hypothetical protein